MAAGTGEVSWLRLLGKHQLTSVAATAVDFAMMIVSVEVFHVYPVVGTVIGATSGAITNFTLGRHWTFRATAGRAHAQALRYAFVSALSLGLNALGVWVLGNVLLLHYVLARVITAVVVALAWNFPMHRYFVFRLHSTTSA